MVETRNGTILVVEDDPGVVQMERKQLERAGYCVVTAETADEALCKVQQGGVDLLVLDNRLSNDQCGLDLFEELRSKGHDLPVIMVTGFSDEATVIKALRAGVRDFVTKSVEYIGYLPEAAGRVLKQVRTENRLAQSEARLIDIFRSAMDAILTIDTNECITLFNAAAERMFECTESEAIGQAIGRFIPDGSSRVINGDSNGSELTERNACLICGRSETYGVRSSGEKFPVEASISQVDVGGRRFRTVIARDISERKRSEHALAEQAEDLARSNADLEKFAYVASHDLQEPLRMVASYLQLLQRRYQNKLDATADEFIDFAVDGAKRMKELLNDLLAYSRVNSRCNTIGPLNWSVILSEVLSNLRIAINESGAVVTHDPLPNVCTDATQVIQLLQNLIANAIKFRTAEAPRVHISAARRGNTWTFSVRDNGIGIDPQYHERIFVLFQRLHNRTEYPGTGIGLAICKKIVERYGGRIWVESQPGHGATFYFTLSA